MLLATLLWECDVALMLLLPPITDEPAAPRVLPTVVPRGVGPPDGTEDFIDPLALFKDINAS